MATKVTGKASTSTVKKTVPISGNIAAKAVQPAVTLPSGNLSATVTSSPADKSIDTSALKTLLNSTQPASKAVDTSTPTATKDPYDSSGVSSILKMAAEAVKNLNGTVNPSPSASYEPYLTEPLDGLKVNNLDEYVTPQLRNDYIRDRATIQDALDRATNAAFDVQRAQAIQDSLKAEDTNYRNTLNAISEMRRNLIGSASSGANVGAANATALQALLGLGQQNTDLTTEGLRNITNVDRERTAQLAQNAADAITAANDATSRMYDVANSAYGSDRSYAAQGAAEALGNIRSTDITSRSNERMNDATNAINKIIAEIQAKAQTDVADTEAKAQKEVTKLANNTTTTTKKTGNKTTTTVKTNSTKKSSAKKTTKKKTTKSKKKK